MTFVRNEIVNFFKKIMFYSKKLVFNCWIDFACNDIAHSLME
jgi:hypothetical protein